ncbi:Fe-S protein assembly co-chaperone HscB [Betaproteobacteria bacterium PRO7]|nr:Fe-S protein assembly co-chaperone HscB [Burkholderiaceae bacterium]MDL1860213.1 Fe-S protein assembly co-chaperone HscB [Betaproteobacteria bacterium PRO7]
MTTRAPDHFALFGLEPRFALDAEALERAYRRVQERVHPDRFAAGSAAERRVAMQWATRANEAFQTLRSPLKRAAYLCERHGAPIAAESNTAMPAEFLVRQLELREALDEARSDRDPASLVRLRDEVRRLREETLAALADALDGVQDYPRAAGLVRQLMFIEKFGDEVAAAEVEAA